MKPRLSVYWAAACGGCEISIVNLHEKLLALDAAFEFVFCPCLLDTKVSDVEAMDDGSIDVTLFNGAIRTSENEDMAHLLRRKSRLLVAFGSCAAAGCVLGLANLSSRDALLQTVYSNNPSIDNPDNSRPCETTSMPEGTLHLPRFQERVRTLAQVVPVDYSVPGCPPEPHQIWKVIQELGGGTLPRRGAVLGGGTSSVCQECDRQRIDKRLARLYRTWQVAPDPKLCLLDQGLVCMGIATRDGCGALCPKVNMPCIGCYGAAEGVLDVGGKMASTIGSMLDIEPLKQGDPADINAAIDERLDALPDLAGTFYKFSAATTLVIPPPPLSGTLPRGKDQQT